MKLFGRVVAVCVAALVVTACAVGGKIDEGDIPGDGEGGTLPGKDGSGGGCTMMCNGQCSDPKTDPANCGKCGNVCPADAMCVAGQCKCPATDGGSAVICNGQCVDTKTDPNNCGQCGLKCGSEGGALTGGGTWICSNGACNIQCAMPKSACVPFGCFDLQTDNKNCGACGTDCGGNLCLAGNCCQQGEVSCNNVCTNTQTDSKNCGMCGTMCANNGPCTMGKCCSAPPKGSCSHLPCTTGTYLNSGCDGVGCVTKVCQNDSFCCAVSWDSYCVQEVDQYCAPSYKCQC